MHTRSGPFWDGVHGRAPIPPAAATLGFAFVDADVPGGLAGRRRQIATATATARVIPLSSAPVAA